MPAIAIAVATWVVDTAVTIGATVAAASPLLAGVGGFIATAGDVLGSAILALGGADGLFAAAEAWSVVAGLAGFLAHPQIGQGPSNPVDFKADTLAGMPYVVGRTGVAGNIVAVFPSDDSNAQFLNYVTVLSVGPVTKVESFRANGVPITFDGTSGAVLNVGVNYLGNWSSATNYALDDAVTYLGSDYICTNPNKNDAPPDAASWASLPNRNAPSHYQNRMAMLTTLGGSPDAALGVPPTWSGQMTTSSWTSAMGLSGLCSARWVLSQDPNAYPGGTPKPLWVVLGPAVYDPRLDSTYPGGSGAQRAADPTTWAYSENPYLHALTFILGRKTNGVRVIGLGAPVSAIDVAAFVTGANVADANGWKIGGFVTSNDSKMQVLSAMLQAGGGVPVQQGAQISCMVQTPRVSLATLTGADVVGDASIAGTQPRRDRINTIRPRYRSEPQGWKIIDAAVVQSASLVAVDGRERDKSVEFSMVQQATQCAQLSAYVIYDSREFGPVTLPLKPRWLGIKPGDCITVNEPELLLNNQLLLCVDRKRNPATMSPVLTFRSETTAKHAQALGLTAAAAPTASLKGVPPTVNAPQTGAWVVAAVGVGGETGAAPILTITGAVDDARAAGVIVDYRQVLTPTTFGPWVSASFSTTSTTININVGAFGDYQSRVRYRAPTGAEDSTVYLDLGTHTVGLPLTTAPADVTGLALVYVAGITRITWTPISDFRAIDYEIRVGTAWGSSPKVAETSSPILTSLGDGTYWVAAHYSIPNGGGDVYSTNPVSIVVSGSQITANILSTHDEYATSWTGTLSNATVSGGFVQGNAGAGSVSYTIPTGHRIDVGYVPTAGAQLIVKYAVIGQSTTSDVLSMTDVLAVGDLLGGALGKFITATPQIRVSQTGTWTGAEPWVPWTPGSYVGRAFDFRMVMSSSDPTVVPVLTAFTVEVDLPTRTDTYVNQAVVAGGSSFTYQVAGANAAFNAGPGGATVPDFDVFIVNKQAGDTEVVTATLSAISVQVKNGGVGVARNVNIKVRGY